MKLLSLVFIMLGFMLAPEKLQKVDKQIAQQGEESVDVTIEFGAGHLYINPVQEDVVYSGTFTYLEREPRITYRKLGSEGRLILEMDDEKTDIEDESDQEEIRENEWNLNFARNLGYEFDIKMGAVEAEMDLGGIRIKYFKLECGASKARIDFSKPNPVIMDRLKLEMGVSKFAALNLLDANFREMRFEGSIGDYRLDFGGELEEQTGVYIDVSLGALTIDIPAGVPFRLECEEGILNSLDIEGAYQQDDRWYSRNFKPDAPYLDFSIDSGIGSVKVEITRD
jgi:hypothetical protein